MLVGFVVLFPMFVALLSLGALVLMFVLATMGLVLGTPHGFVVGMPFDLHDSDLVDADSGVSGALALVVVLALVLFLVAVVLPAFVLADLLLPF